MKALIIYDSVQGNTEKVARAMAEALAPATAQLMRPGEAATADLKSFDLLLIGSPTMGGRPTQPMQDFLAKIPADGLKDIAVAAFDTRVKAAWVKIFGFASRRIADSLTAKGGKLLAPPEGFFVAGSKGPLKDGELERAAGWIKALPSAGK